MGQLLEQTWFIAACGVLAGGVLAWLAGHFGGAKSSNLSVDYTKQINSLTSNINVARKERDLAKERASAAEGRLGEKEHRIRELEAQFEARSTEYEKARADLKNAVAKTVELRRELVERAEDTVRANVHARDVEQELEMLQNSGELLDSELMAAKGDKG